MIYNITMKKQIETFTIQPFENISFLSLLGRQRARMSEDRRIIHSFFLGRLRIRTAIDLRADMHRVPVE